MDLNRDAGDSGGEKSLSLGRLHWDSMPRVSMTPGSAANEYGSEHHELTMTCKEFIDFLPIYMAYGGAGL